MRPSFFQCWWQNGQSPTEALLEALARGLAEAVAWSVLVLLLLQPVGDLDAGGAVLLLSVSAWITTSDRLVRWLRSVRHNLVSMDLVPTEAGGGTLQAVAPWGRGTPWRFDASGKTEGGRLRMVQTADGLVVVPPEGLPIPLHGDRAQRLRAAGVRSIDREHAPIWVGKARPVLRWAALVLVAVGLGAFWRQPVDPTLLWSVLVLFGVVVPALGWWDDRAGRVDLDALTTLGVRLYAMSFVLGMLAVAHKREPWSLTCGPTGITAKQGSRTVHVHTGDLRPGVVDLPRGALLLLSRDVALLVDIPADLLHQLWDDLRPMYVEAGDDADARRMRQALETMRRPDQR